MTLTPFTPIISPPSPQLPAPHLLVLLTHIPFKEQTTGLSAKNVGIQRSQEVTFPFPSLPIALTLLGRR